MNNQLVFENISVLEVREDTGESDNEMLTNINMELESFVDTLPSVVNNRKAVRGIIADMEYLASQEFANKLYSFVLEYVNYLKKLYDSWNPDRTEIWLERYMELLGAQLRTYKPIVNVWKYDISITASYTLVLDTTLQKLEGYVVDDIPEFREEEEDDE
jgi:hypothetical protein